MKIFDYLASELLNNRVTDHRVTDTQGYPVNGWGNFLCLISINFPFRFARRGINSACLQAGTVGKL